MFFTRTSIAGAYLIDLDPRVDHRGSFARAFCKQEFAGAGIEFDILQCNLAHTNHAGVVRGLHFQEKPVEDNKLVRCVSGAVFDALVDMRVDSSTYRQVLWVKLDAVARQALFVPGGVAHGYQALVNHTEFLYLTDQYYSPGLEKGVRFDDPSIAVPWPLPPVDVAERDRNWPLLA
jgi:dTDP-4-dehydrorhamnose 3,5-epimerase